MSGPAEAGGRSEVLQSKRDATRYRILVQIAENQPAVSQQEIADAIGITSQAVSNYLQELVTDGYVDKLGRGRYEITKEGVDWLISQTDDLRAFIQHVSDDVIGQVDVDSAIATGAISEGERVSLTMRDGYLHATPGETGDATAVAVTNAERDREVGVTDFEGVVDYQLGTVTVISIPTVRNGGSDDISTSIVQDAAAEHDILAVAGVEALATARNAGITPDIRFGTPEAVQEAALKGLDILLLSVASQLSVHTDKLRENNLTYEVIDASE